MSFVVFTLDRLTFYFCVYTKQIMWKVMTLLLKLFLEVKLFKLCLCVNKCEAGSRFTRKIILEYLLFFIFLWIAKNVFYFLLKSFSDKFYLPSLEKKEISRYGTFMILLFFSKYYDHIFTLVQSEHFWHSCSEDPSVIYVFVAFSFYHPFNLFTDPTHSFAVRPSHARFWRRQEWHGHYNLKSRP